jgi:hypothetical protein
LGKLGLYFIEFCTNEFCISLIGHITLRVDVDMVNLSVGRHCLFWETITIKFVVSMGVAREIIYVLMSWSRHKSI